MLFIRNSLVGSWVSRAEESSCRLCWASACGSRSSMPGRPSSPPSISSGRCSRIRIWMATRRTTWSAIRRHDLTRRGGGEDYSSTGGPVSVRDTLVHQRHRGRTRFDRNPEVARLSASLGELRSQWAGSRPRAYGKSGAEVLYSTLRRHITRLGKQFVEGAFEVISRNARFA